MHDIVPGCLAACDSPMYGVWSMQDLTLGLTVMALMCAGAVYCGAAVQRRGHPVAVRMALVAACLLMAVYLAGIWDRPIVTRLIPHSAAIVLGNWLPVLGAFFVGVCLHTAGITLLRRVVLASVMLSLCTYSLVSPLLGSVPSVLPMNHPRALEFQTTDHTCSSACAAGLLRLHGIPASEQELAELCLTRLGTHWLGVYRGLKLKTEGTDWDVVVDEVTPEQLRSGQIPLGVLTLAFDESVLETSVETGFRPEVGHSVVSLGCREVDLPVIFDPSPDFGLEKWSPADLACVKSAIILRLQSRSGRQPRIDLAEIRRSFWPDTAVVWTVLRPAAEQRIETLE